MEQSVSNIISMIIWSPWPKPHPYLYLFVQLFISHQNFHQRNGKPIPKSLLSMRLFQTNLFFDTPLILLDWRCRPPHIQSYSQKILLLNSFLAPKLQIYYELVRQTPLQEQMGVRELNGHKQLHQYFYWAEYSYDVLLLQTDNA